jgi:hypothetical protein
MRKLRISEILEKADEAPSKEEKMMILQSHDSVPLRQVLQYAYDSRVKWLLPEGPVPYKPSPFMDNDNVLYLEARRFYLFVEGGHDALKQSRRETLFIQMLESLHPADAALLVSIKDKKLPYKTLTPTLINNTWPGTIQMSKSYKRRRAEIEDFEDDQIRTKKKVSTDRRRKKRLDRAIKTRNIDQLVEFEEEV